MDIYILKKCFRKLGGSTNQKVNFVCCYSFMKILFLTKTNMQNKLNKLSKSNVVYQFLCPGCEFSYIYRKKNTLQKNKRKCNLCRLSDERIT